MIFPSGFVYLFVCFFKDSFIYLRESMSMSVGGGGKGERESQADSLLSAEPDAGLDLII